MAKRKYEKRDKAYWGQFDQMKQANAGPVIKKSGGDESAPFSAGEPFYKEVSVARTSTSSSSTRTKKRRNFASRAAKSDRFVNIDNYSLPYEESSEGIGIKDTVILCRKAYSNVPIVKNTVDIMSELSNSTTYLEGGSKKSRDFVKRWFKRIKLWRVKDQFFREYFRSSNIFTQRITGRVPLSDLRKITKSYGNKGPNGTKIPLRYVFLDSAEILIDPHTPFSNPLFKKVLSKYDIARLKNSEREEDKEDLKSFPVDVQQKIKSGAYTDDGVYMHLDPKELISVFAKKQDYEPFATPFIFPVLDDINWKIELKKVDQAITRTIENVILLITHGAEEEKGGFSQANHNALQEIFLNESIGRVLVADHTTKADFIIPDLKKVLGPEKYEIVNQDIKEGLQNVILGNEKFANSQIKAGIFLERLNDARQSFVQDFIQPEVDEVCKTMGFRDAPVVKFEELDLKDEIQFQRIVIRLMELGMISAEQGLESLREGVLPEPDSLEEAQKKFKEQREEGYYNPIMGGVQMFEGANDGDDNFGGPKGKDKNNKKQAGPKKEHGRPMGTKEIKHDNASERFSVAAIKDVTIKANSLVEKSRTIARKVFNKKRLNKNQKELLDKIVESVVISREMDEWDDFLEQCIKDPNKLTEVIAKSEVLEISAEHNVDDYTAAILYHSTE